MLTMSRAVYRSLLLSLATVSPSACSIFDVLRPHNGTPENQLVWKDERAPTGRPATDGNRVYFATKEHRVVALDAATGREIWSATADSGAVEHVPTFAGCTVGDAVVACGDDGDLVAFTRADGLFAWRFHPPIGRLVDVHPFSAVDSTFYTGTAAGPILFAVSSRTGSPRWSASVPGLEGDCAVRDPAADTDIVVAPYVRYGKPMTGGVVAVDAHSGAIRWNTPLTRILPDSDSSGAYAVLWRDLVIASSNSGRIYGIDRVTGAIRWNAAGVGKNPPTSAPRPVIWDYRALAVTGDHVIASSMYGWLTAYDANTGKQSWEVYPGLSDGNGNPIQTDGQNVYVTFFRGTVGVLAVSDGKLLSVANDTDLLSSVALGVDKFFAPGDHGLYAYRK